MASTSTDFNSTGLRSAATRSSAPCASCAIGGKTYRLFGRL